MSQPVPLERLAIPAERLMREHPPVLRDRNKRAVFRLACPEGAAHGGTIEYSRWPAMSLPEHVDGSAACRLLEGRQDVYDYVPLSGDGVEWHVNFADPHLFVAYGSGLFAQDEIQVAEHPTLGALREALVARHMPAATVEGGRHTPVLVMGVERRCHVQTAADLPSGRPALYGNAFARATEEVVVTATRRLDPPTVSHILAIAAPQGSGRYRRAEIGAVLGTATSGFRAAVLETGRARPGATTVVHTGFWGCGAFGGNRVLMAMVQTLAAAMAGVGRLVFHTFDAPGSQALDEARQRMGGIPRGATPHPCPGGSPRCHGVRLGGE